MFLPLCLLNALCKRFCQNSWVLNFYNINPNGHLVCNLIYCFMQRVQVPPDWQFTTSNSLYSAFLYDEKKMLDPSGFVNECEIVYYIFVIILPFMRIVT